MPRIINYTPNALTHVGGSDLGAPFVMPNGKVGLVQGDTWDGTVAKTGSGPWWRSPVILTSPTRDPGANVLEIDGAVRGGDQLWDYEHNNPVFSTVLPCDAITIGSRIYVWVMVTAGLGNEKWCEIWYSDDLGENWINGTQYVNGQSVWNTAHFGGKRTMITWDRGRDGWVYAVSTGGLARDKNAIMWRVRETEILDKSKWEARVFRNGSWSWAIDPPDPADILPAGTMCGEMCLRWIQGHWVLSYLELNQGATTVKVGYSGVPGSATSPPSAINWMTTPTYRPIRSGPLAVLLGGEAMERFYGCYVHPDSRFDGKFSLIMSEWLLWSQAPYNGEGPYRSSHWRMKTTPTALGPLIPDPSPAGGEDNWDAVLAEFTG